MLPLQLFFGHLEGPVIFLFVVLIIIWSIALVAIANGRFYDNTTKLCWFFIVLTLNVIGILLFVLWGRWQVDNGKRNKNNT